MAIAVLAVAPPAQADSGAPVRLGNNTEDIELITSGRFAGQIAVLDGWDVFTIPVNAPTTTQPRHLFDVKDVPWSAFASGMAYLPDEKVFVFGDQGQFEELVVVDSTGNHLPSRLIDYLPGNPETIGSEGLVYLDEDAAFPNTIARAVLRDDFSVAIQILRPDGVQVKEIEVVGLPEEDAYIVGLAYLKDNRFLISTARGLWHVDLAGTVTGGPRAVPQVPSPEGLAAVPSGRVYVAGYTRGVLLAYDRGLVRDAGRDRPYPVGPGLSRASSGFWDEVTGTWVVNGYDRIDMRGTVASVPPSLDSRTVLFHPPEADFVLARSSGQNLALGSFSSGVVREYDRTGALLDTLDLEAAGVPPSFGVRGLAYVESLDAYAVRVAGFGLLNTIYIVSRDEGLVRTITAPFPFALLSSDPDDGAKLLAWGIRTGPLATYDAATGELLSITEPDTGQAAIPFHYLGGPNGDYAILDNNESSITVFQHP